MTKTLQELRTQIEVEVEYVDIKPYSHNIIGLVLTEINERFGNKEANQAIEDFGLEELGWNKTMDH